MKYEENVKQIGTFVSHCVCTHTPMTRSQCKMHFLLLIRVKKCFQVVSCLHSFNKNKRPKRYELLSEVLNTNTNTGALPQGI